MFITLEIDWAPELCSLGHSLRNYLVRIPFRNQINHQLFGTIDSIAKLFSVRTPFETGECAVKWPTKWEMLFDLLFGSLALKIHCQNCQNGFIYKKTEISNRNKIMRILSYCTLLWLLLHRTNEKWIWLDSFFDKYVIYGDASWTTNR